MSSDGNIYIKEGRKYKPVGVSFPRDFLGDGIWMVRHRPGITETTNLGYYGSQYGVHKIGEIPSIDFVTAAGVEARVDEIAKIIRDDSKPRSHVDTAREILWYLATTKGPDWHPMAGRGVEPWGSIRRDAGVNQPEPDGGAQPWSETREGQRAG